VAKEHCCAELSEDDSISLNAPSRMLLTHHKQSYRIPQTIPESKDKIISH